MFFQGLRRSAERRHRRGPADCHARRLSLDRACQALHHRGHGNRPGQDVERQRPGHCRRPAATADLRCRAHDVPHALYAGDIRHAGRRRARRIAGAGAAHAAARLGRGAGCGLRGRRHLEACPLLSAHRRIATRRRRARMPCRARCRGSVRRHHARQDRSRWPGCRGIPRSDLYDRCRQSGRWTLPLCPYAGRERLRAGRRHHRPARTRPLPRHHHHGRRRDRAAPHGGLSADRIPPPARLADVDHRTMGRHRCARPPGAHAARAAAAGCRPGRHAAYERARVPHRRRPGALVPRQLHGRSWLRGQRARGIFADGVGNCCWLPASHSAPRPTAPRRCTCCAPRRATSSLGRKPTGR